MKKRLPHFVRTRINLCQQFTALDASTEDELEATNGSQQSISFAIPLDRRANCGSLACQHGAVTHMYLVMLTLGSN